MLTSSLSAEMSFPVRQALHPPLLIDDERCTASLFLCADYRPMGRKAD